MDERVTTDCLANARALAPVIAAAAARIEAMRTLPDDLVDALHQARLFRMLVPRSLGGEEISPIAFLEVLEELAKADASTAWCIAQTSVCATIAKCLHPEVGAEIFKANPRGVLAWGPSTSGAIAVAADGGYRVTGTWPFASGSRHATWLAAHCRINEKNGEPRRDAAGKHAEKTFVVPRESAAIADTWQVIGLKGTGSDTYSLREVFVPEKYAINLHALDAKERHEHGPLYSFTIYQLFGSAFPVIALGIARAMLDSFIELAKTKIPAGASVPMRDNPVIQSQVGVAEAKLAAARTFLFAAWDDIWQAAQAGAQTDTMPLEQRVRLRASSIHASEAAREVVDTAYRAAGALAVFAGNPFERRFRDMHAVSQQAQSQLAIYEAVGRYYLGFPVNPRLI